MGVELLLTDDDREPCATSVYPEGEDFNPKKGLAELILDFGLCKDSKADLIEKIDLYNAEQKQKQKAD